MSYTEATLQLLSPTGNLVESDATAEYLPYIEALSDDQLREFHRVMVVTRAFDQEGTNLQRQGQMGLWVPSLGQEAAQVGSGFAMRPAGSHLPVLPRARGRHHPRPRRPRHRPPAARADARRLDPRR